MGIAQARGRPDSGSEGLRWRSVTLRFIRIIWFEGFVTSSGAWVGSNIKNRVLRTTELLQRYGRKVTAEGNDYFAEVIVPDIKPVKLR